MPALKTIIVILGDQLTRKLLSLQNADPATSIFLMAEVAAEASHVKHHKKCKVNDLAGHRLVEIIALRGVLGLDQSCGLISHTQTLPTIDRKSTGNELAWVASNTGRS